MYKSKPEFRIPIEEDVWDAISYYCDIVECNPEHWVEKTISKVKYTEARNITDVSSWGGGYTDSGWLLDVPKSEWAEELHSSYSREFEHIIAQYERKELRPVIVIDGYICDGRGRSMFLEAIGEKVPYVEVELEPVKLPIARPRWA